MDWELHQPAFGELLAAFRREYAPVYVVGGAVRDLLLARSTGIDDLDLVVESGALEAGRRIADRLGWAFYPLDQTRDVARLVFATGSQHPLVCDVAGLRGGSIEADLLSRDFTVNAMALAYGRTGEPTLVDPYGGRADLRRSLIRRVSASSLAEDTIRVLRAVRLVVQLGFQLDPATETQVQRLASGVRLHSPERIRDELWKMLAEENAPQAVALLHEFRILPHVLPEVEATVGVAQSLPHHQDVFRHTLSAIQWVIQLRRWVMGSTAKLGKAEPAIESLLGRWRFRLRHHFQITTAAGRTRGDWLVWHALFHDIGKPSTQSEEPDTEGHSARIRFLGHEEVGADLAEERVEDLHFSRHEIDLVAAVVRGHMRPHALHSSFTDQPISRRALYRYHRDSEGKQFGDHAGIDTALLALADYLATFQVSPPPDWGAYVDHISQLLSFTLELPKTEALGKPLVDGHELMRRLDLEPGPQVGEILEQLREAQAAGEITTAEDALRLAVGLLDRRGD